MSQIHKNLDIIYKNISESCKKYQRRAEDINLIAVCKTIMAEKIQDAIDYGCINFGENRVEEVKQKWPELLKKYPNVKLHLIGHLQSKKAKDAVKFFDYIHSVDSLKLAEILKNEMEKQQKFPKIFLQINIGSEENKNGIDLKKTEEIIKKIKFDIQLPIFGLMCIPPINEEPTPYFALLHKIAKKFQINNLSMGMSSDYEKAIAINSNYIRVGTSIFGSRINKG